MPAPRDDEYDDRGDDRPRRPRRDDEDDFDDDRPRRRRRRYRDDGRPGSGGRSVLTCVVIAVVAPVVLCGGGIAAFFIFRPKPVEVLDATRGATPDGGTGTVTVSVRFKDGDKPGGMIFGDYNFVFRANGRTSLHGVGLRGHAGGIYKATFITPELAKEAGPVEFWVERDERGSTSRVSEVRRIP
jgi:hypothetical protein